jgi:flagellar FliL protein
MSDEDDIPLPPKRGKALPVVLAMNTLLLAGVLVFLARRPAPVAAAVAAEPAAEAAAPAEKGHGGGHAEEAPGPTVKLDNFIIQLKTVETDRYVRVTFDLELQNEADKAVIAARLAPIRDSIISYFSDRTLDELRGSEGMEQTKILLMKRLGDVIPGRRIKALYITDFVVQ